MNLENISSEIIDEDFQNISTGEDIIEINRAYFEGYTTDKKITRRKEYDSKMDELINAKLP